VRPVHEVQAPLPGQRPAQHAAVQRPHGGIKDTGKVIDTKARNHLIDDGRGNMIPDHPGKVIPLSQLPADHPALFYMEQMLGLAWCEEEAPIDREIGRFYRKLHYRWRDTPQGRIIFHAYIRGIRQLWQGRYLEHADDTTHWMCPPTTRNGSSMRSGRDPSRPG
jgi:hypothetical protein